MEPTVTANTELAPVAPPGPAATLPAVVFSPGTVLNGRYRIERELGRGAMGVVYKAIDTLASDRPIALKTIAGDALDPTRLALFKAEFRTSARLRHPNIASAYDFEPLQGTQHHLFTMEYVAGTRPSGVRTWEVVVELLVQLCRALSFVHSRGIVHFDIKPDNMMLTASGEIKVLDFGVSGAAIDRHGIRGTPHYMAPELLDPEAEVDHRVDLYALGISAYQMLTGKLPFTGHNVLEIMRQHVDLAVTFDAEAQAAIPPWLRNIVERLCAKEPAHRYRTANATIEAINHDGGHNYALETAETRESYILCSRFVGRDRDLQRLLDFVGPRRSGSEPAIFVCGQSGVGKSRLMRELRMQAQLSRQYFISASCYERGAAEHGTAAQLIRHLVRLCDATGAQDLIDLFGRELVKIEPELLAARGIAPSARHHEPDAERRRLLDQTAEFFVRLAKRVPYLLYVEDLHWASEMTADLFRILVAKVAGSGGTELKLLGSFRDDEIEGKPAARLLRAIDGQHALIRLEPLAPEHIAPLLASMLGIDTLPASFVARVTHETGGNPYFAEEVMRALVENGAVFIARGSWAASEDVGALDIPSTVQSAVLRRASLLDPTARHALEMLSVYAQPVSAALLAQLLGCPADALATALTDLEQRRMAMRIASDDITYRIAHDHIRETIYADLAPAERSALHRGVVEALERQNAPDRHLFALAHHSAHADRPAIAFSYARRAGIAAKETFANDLAIELFERALRLFPAHEPEALRRELREHLADARAGAAKYDQALDGYTKLCADAPDALGQARYSRKMAAMHLQLGDLGKCVDSCWQAITTLGGRRVQGRVDFAVVFGRAFAVHLAHRWLPWTARRAKGSDAIALRTELAEVYLRLGGTYYFADPPKAAPMLLLASNLAETLGPSQVLVGAYLFIAMIYGQRTFYDSSLYYERRASQIAEAMDSSLLRGLADVYSMVTYHLMGNWEQCVALLPGAQKTIVQAGDMYEAAGMFNAAGMSLIRAGKLQQADAILSEAITLYERLGAQQGFGKMCFICRAWVDVERGNWSRALEQLRWALDVSEQAKDPLATVQAHTIFGRYHLARGELPVSIEHLERARMLRESARLPHDYVIDVYALLVKAEAAMLRGQSYPTAERQRVLARITERADLATRLARRRPNHRPAAALAQALVSELVGTAERTRGSYLRAIASAEHAGAELSRAEANREFGRWLATLGPRHETEARSHGERAARLLASLIGEPATER